MSPDQIVAKIARGKGSGTVPTVDEATRINYDACERISETRSMPSTVTPELLFAPFFVTGHVRPGLTAHWASVPWVHRHQGSNRTEEAQVYPAERPSRSHMVRPAPTQFPWTRTTRATGSAEPVRSAIASSWCDHQNTMTQPCFREGVNAK